MRLKSILIAILFVLNSFLISKAMCQDSMQFPDHSRILKTLKPEHPRLFLDLNELQSLRIQMESSGFLNDMQAALLQKAKKTINEPPVEYKLRGPRLLHQSRKCLDRVSTMSFAFLLTGNERFAQRAKRELFAAAAFPDWNPSHFLDVAELSAAFGVGYDWLYHVLSDSEKVVIRQALLEKGLRPGLIKYEEPAWWVNNPFNWNQVCNGGLSIGALAIADEEPEVASKILSHAVSNLPFAMASYAPDGGWAEGPGYWSYATRYTTMMLAALVSALGTDFGLSEAPGFDQAGLFPIHCTGPIGLTFNYADASPTSTPMASMYWLARRFDLPICALEQKKRFEENMAKGGAPTAWDLIWYQTFGSNLPDLPPNAFYQGVNVVFFRSNWRDPEAIFVGFKGGDNQANHAHLDLGTFVFDALGVRWAVDLGRDNYNLPGYWQDNEGGKRWSYFRLNNRSHNTLTLNDDTQRANAKAPIIQTRFKDDKSFAIADLSAAYLPHAEKVQRGIALLEKRYVLVQDEIEWQSDQRQLVWNMMTSAQIKLDGERAKLVRNENSLTATILAPKAAVFDTASAHRDSPEQSNAGFRRLVIRHTEQAKKTRIAVLFSPDTVKKVEIQPLKKW